MGYFRISGCAITYFLKEFPFRNEETGTTKSAFSMLPDMMLLPLQLSIIEANTDPPRQANPHVLINVFLSTGLQRFQKFYQCVFIRLR